MIFPSQIKRGARIGRSLFRWEKPSIIYIPLLTLLLLHLIAEKPNKLPLTIKKIDNIENAALYWIKILEM